MVGELHQLVAVVSYFIDSVGEVQRVREPVLFLRFLVQDQSS